MAERATISTQPSPGREPPAAGRATATAGERYELVRELGRGAMGTVWLARDRALDREVAVKLLHDRYLSETHQQRLADEARAMARLSHGNVVAVYDVGERDGRTFVAMELVRGAPLSQWLTTPRPWREVVRVFRAVGDGLAAAHASGLVHRDVKPSNILLGDDGRPRLADFGVAHTSPVAGAPATTASATAGPIGSPAYMPPERLIGDAGGARGDQFGFCAALYEALHGRRPFPGDTAAEIVEAIRRGPPPPVRPVPRWLHAAVARGLAAEPSARFASMPALLAALRDRSWRRAGIAALAVGAIVAVAGAAVAWGPRDDAAAPQPATAPATIEDAAVVAPPDAASLDAAPTPPDATVAAPKPPARRQPPRDPAASLSIDEARVRYRALRAEWTAAVDRGDLREARTLAERAVPYGMRLGTADPKQVIMVMSCRLGDERAARAAYRTLPRGTPQAKYLQNDMVNACRMHGLELSDLLE